MGIDIIYGVLWYIFFFVLFLFEFCKYGVVGVVDCGSNELLMGASVM